MAQLLAGPERCASLKAGASGAEEGQVIWMQTFATGAIALIVFWAPGWWILGSPRIDSLRRFALAPVVTTFLCGSGAVVTGLLGVSWNLLSMLVTFAVGLSVVQLVRRRSRARRRYRTPASAPRDRGSNDSPPRTPNARTIVFVALGALIILVPFAIGMGSPERTLNAWDAPFHLNLLEYIRETGHASPLDVIDMLGNGPHQGVYPTGWHSIAALVPVWPSRAVVFTVTAYLPIALAWSAGLSFLTDVLFQDSPSAAMLAPLFAATGAVPVYAMSTLGIVADAWALALIPATAAAVIRAWRYRAPHDIGLAVVCVLGLGLAHPTPVIALAIAALPVSVPAVARLLKRAWHLRYGLVVVTAGTALSVAAVAFALRHTILGGVLQLKGAASSGWPWSVFDAVNGSQGATVSSGIVVVAGAAVATRLVWNDRDVRGVLLGGAILLALPIVADARFGIAAVLLRPWYSEVARLAPVAWALIVALASFGITEGTRRLVASGRLDAGSRPQLAIPLVAGVCVVFAGVPTFIGSVHLAERALSGSPDAAPYISIPEQQMIDRLPRELDPTKAVLGSTYSGASHLYGLIGQRVSLRYHFSRPDTAIRYISAHLDSLGADPVLCAALRTEHVRYLYIDSRPSALGGDMPGFLKPPPAGVSLVDRGGSAAVYEVTACE
ncbi:MAG: DUF6541 family protein [Cellulomonas sp.]